MLQRRSARRWLALLLTAFAVIGTASCTGSDSSGPEVRTTIEKVWTAADIDPVSAVEEVDGVAVVYGTSGDDLLIYGLDPVTGAQLWSKPATLLTDESDSIKVSEIDGAVAYFRPTGTQRLAQLVLADPKTGADLTVSAPRYWYTLPVRCDDDAWVCLTSYVQQSDGHWDMREFRVNRKTGETAPGDPTDAPNDNTHALPVADLFYSYPGDGSVQIGRHVDGSVLWSKPSTDIWGPTMPHPSFFTFWDPNGRDFAVMTTLGRGTDQTGGTQLDLAKDVVSASFSLADGAVRWVSPGTSVGCSGDRNLGWDVSTHSAEALAYRCRYTGSAVRNWSALRGSELTTTGLSVTVEGFDPATGDARWSTDVGDARALADDTTTGGESALLDDAHLYVPNSAGGLVIDLQTGQSRPSVADDVLWCADEGTFHRPEPYYAESTPILTAKRSGVVHPCRSDGTAAPLPTAAIPAKLSASFDGDRRVIALSDGVAGFLVPPAGGAGGEATQTATPDSAPSSGTSSDSAAPAASASASSSSADSTPAEPVLHSVEQAWAATGFEAKTSPVIVSGTAVLYGTVGTQLFLIGLDPATGAERWRRPATAAALSPHLEVAVVTIDDKVAYLRPVQDDRMSQIVLIDPATGADTIVTEPRWWLGFPGVCADDPAYLCASAYNLDDTSTTLQSRRFRVDRATGALTLVPETPSAPSAPYTTLWNDVVQISGAPTDTVGIVRDGAVVWSRPLTDLAGPGATLDYGWHMSEDNGTTPVLEMSVRTGWSGDGTGNPSLDLAANLVTVGVNRNDGTVVWSKPGTWSECRGKLPSASQASTPGSSGPALRCRYTGRLDSTPPNRGYDLTVPTDLTVTLERVDLQTGEAIWSVPLGAEPSLAVDAFGKTVRLLDDRRLLTGGRVVNIDDGTSRPPAAGETFWCPGPQSFEQTVEWLGTDGSVRRDRRAQGEVYECDGAGNAATGTPAAVPLAVSAVTDDGLRLVSTPAGVVAYRVPV